LGRYITANVGCATLRSGIVGHTRAVAHRHKHAGSVYPCLIVMKVGETLNFTELIKFPQLQRNSEGWRLYAGTSVYIGHEPQGTVQCVPSFPCRNP
jgi:hypothetical protein